MEIILYVNEAELGPFSLDVVKAMLENGDVDLEDYAWFEGCENYVTVAEIPGIDDAAKPRAEILAFVWPDGAKDWQGPHSLPHIQTLLARRTLAMDDFAAWEGSPEGASVAEIPGLEIPEGLLGDSSSAGSYLEGNGEPAAESKAVAPTATRRVHRSKRGGSRGSQIKASQKTNSPLHVPTGPRGLDVKSKAFRNNLNQDPVHAGRWIRIPAGIVLTLAILFNVYAGIVAPGAAEEFSAKAASAITSENPTQKTNFDTALHTQMHAYGLYAAAGFCLLSTFHVFVCKRNFPVTFSGFVITLVGIWGMVAAFFGTTPFIFSSGLANLMTGILTLAAAKYCH
jgi:hypothetical protein